MVIDKKFVTIQDKKVKLKSNLNCKSSGIYVALCTNCDSNYVGQTKNSFSIRWSAHRANLKKIKTKFNIKDLSDESALYRHYYNKHKDNLKNLNIDKSYTVGFFEQPDSRNLDYIPRTFLD